MKRPNRPAKPVTKARTEPAEIDRILRARLTDIDRGEPGMPAEQVLAELRERLGIKRQ